MNDNLKLVLKLISLMGLIWGIGWLLFESLDLHKNFSSSSYQNMLLVLMSAVWLVLLLGFIDKEKPPKVVVIHKDNTPELVKPKKIENKKKRGRPPNSQPKSNQDTKIDIDELIKIKLENNKQ